MIQKSIREGFGLVVSESLWKGTPVVAGRAGGIPLQLQDGDGGYLVDSVEECAARTLELLADPEAAASSAKPGQALVRERFLLTRLIADELRLYASVLGSEPDKDAGRPSVPPARNATPSAACESTSATRPSPRLRPPRLLLLLTHLRRRVRARSGNDSSARLSILPQVTTSAHWLRRFRPQSR